MLATIIHRYNKKSFHFKNERLITEILQAVCATFLARRDYIPGELMLSLGHWRLRLSCPRQFVFVCVEVLRPSQPNGVMLNAASLPNHTFTEQA